VALLLRSLFVFIVAAAVGLGSTYFVLNRDTAFGALSIGAWTAWPKSGTLNADPYARAAIARSGRLPMALGDGVSFSAQADDRGRSLDGRCDVVVAGVTPAARFWTLTLYDPAGELIANSVGRYGFTSEEVVRSADGSFAIMVAPRASPGNWLPTGGIESYLLVLRFYDTAIGVATRASRELPMPTVKTKGCP
jgi:hypothetical protein